MKKEYLFWLQKTSRRSSDLRRETKYLTAIENLQKLYSIQKTCTEPSGFPVLEKGILGSENL